MVLHLRRRDLSSFPLLHANASPRQRCHDRRRKAILQAARGRTKGCGATQFLFVDDDQIPEDLTHVSPHVHRQVYVFSIMEVAKETGAMDTEDDALLQPLAPLDEINEDVLSQ
jgi:hypothetical protein